MATPQHPSWLAATPGYQEVLQARGRWFTPDRAIAEDYAGGGRFGGAGGPRIRYIDLPHEQAQRYALTNVANRDLDEARRYSTARAEEYFLPRELADAASPLPVPLARADAEFLPGLELDP